MRIDEWLSSRLAKTKAAGLYRSLKLPQAERTNWASNDYLGLANDKRLIHAAETALRRFGAGSTALS